MASAGRAPEAWPKPSARADDLLPQDSGSTTGQLVNMSSFVSITPRLGSGPKDHGRTTAQITVYANWRAANALCSPGVTEVEAEARSGSRNHEHRLGGMATSCASRLDTSSRHSCSPSSSCTWCWRRQFESFLHPLHLIAVAALSGGALAHSASVELPDRSFGMYRCSWAS